MKGRRKGDLLLSIDQLNCWTELMNRTGEQSSTPLESANIQYPLGTEQVLPLYALSFSLILHSSPWWTSKASTCTSNWLSNRQLSLLNYKSNVKSLPLLSSSWVYLFERRMNGEHETWWWEDRETRISEKGSSSSLNLHDLMLRKQIR